MSGASIEPSAGPCIAEHHAKIDHFERLEPEIAQVVVYRLGQCLGEKAGSQEPSAPRRAPILVTMTRSFGIGRERLADDLVGDVRAVEVAGVDVVDAARDRLAQHGERRVAILRRPEYAGAGELHRAVADPFHVAVAERKVPDLPIFVMRVLL